MEGFVSPDGSPDNAGTVDSPWSLTKGLTEMSEGDVLFLRGGSYPGNFTIKGRHGTAAHPIVVRSFPGEHAIIDGSDPKLWVAPNDHWHPVGEPAIGEFESNDPFPHGPNRAARGSFFDRVPYTRLITNTTLQDLRADNQLFGPLSGPGQLDGPEPANGDQRFPWVYMGPGIFQNPVTGKVHIRLAPTTNNLPGFEDYAGPIDPTQVPIAIGTSLLPVLRITDCTSLHLSDLTVRHGRRCVRVDRSSDVRLDHLNIYAGSYGVEFGELCANAVMTHCVVDGGLPPWFFRSDVKTSYDYSFEGVEATNRLGVNTAKSLLAGHKSATGTTIRHCELVNGHDLYLFGAQTAFSRNCVTNLDDDAVFAETEGAEGLRIFENVIEQSLMAINFALKKVAGAHVSVYRNLIDLRRPTASVRPRPAGPPGATAPAPLAHGQLFKGNSPDSPLDLFHNTCLVARQDFDTSYAHLRSYTGESPRRCFNNIFVAVNSTSGADLPITLLPDPNYPAATDGNCYFRVGPFTTGALLRHRSYLFGPPPKKPNGSFATLAELRGDPDIPTPPSEYFTHTKTTYPPGFEAAGVATDPLFRRFDSVTGEPAHGDDFRLHFDSPARGAGIILPSDLRKLDGATGTVRPTIGCFRDGAPALAVGVDGRRQFPRQLDG